MHALEKRKAKNFADWLAKKFRVIAPVKLEGKKDCAFEEYAEGKELDLNSKPVFSPKNSFFPAFEEMFEFKEGRIVEMKKSVEKRALFGVRACDLNALNRMNALFSSEKKDAYFAKARENLMVFGLKCTNAWENCFCESIGADELKGHDVEVWEENGKYFFEAKSERGEKLLGGYTGFEEVKQVKKQDEKKSKICLRSVDARNADFAKINWAEWGRKCFACSNCVMVCPSCTCFDVFDELDLSLKNGKRKRTWASCLTVEFASISNTCFRPLKPERFKQFVMHKFKYYKDKFGEFMCTGCGRCIDYCPKGIDVIEVLEEGKAKENECKVKEK